MEKTSMQTDDTPVRRKLRLPVVASAAGILGGALLLTASPAGAAGTDTGSGTLLYVGQGANGCRAAGAVDFRDRGDRFTVHDYCPDGYRIVLEVTQRTGVPPQLTTDDGITNANGYDGAAKSESINISDGSPAEVTLIVADGDREISRRTRTITE
jgi:hypothetical protein